MNIVLRSKKLHLIQIIVIEIGYTKEKENLQTRVLYKNSAHILARITTQENNDSVVTSINFKDENESDDVLKASRETTSLKVTEDNKEFIMSMLDMLGFNEFKTLKRKRYVYSKNNVKFEIDEYSEPEKMYVVAVEGEKEEVDNIYEEVNKLFNSYLI